MAPELYVIGERCSGTNFLTRLIGENLEVDVNIRPFHKHSFIHEEFAEDIIFVGIAREPYEWANSLAKKRWHLKGKLLTNIHDKSEKAERCKINYNVREERMYEDIMEMRTDKLRFLLDEAPKKISKYIFVRYEDVCEDNGKFLRTLAEKFNLSYRFHEFKPIDNYKGRSKMGTYQKSNKYVLNKEDVYSHTHLDKELEEKAGY